MKTRLKRQQQHNHHLLRRPQILLQYNSTTAIVAVLVLMLGVFAPVANSFPLQSSRSFLHSHSNAAGAATVQQQRQQQELRLRPLPSRRYSFIQPADGDDDNEVCCSEHYGSAVAPAATTMPPLVSLSSSSSSSPRRSDRNVGGYDPSEKITPKRGSVNVGDPQILEKKQERSVTSILKELAAIQQQGPQKYCILGTRHCSYLHQQIIELLAYALVLSGNHVYTSGAGGTHAATIRGALRAERPDLLTVVLPQSMSKQPKESQELLKKVTDVIAMPQNDEMSLDVASRICNSYLLSLTDQLISFAFHESSTVIEAAKEAKKLDMLVTMLYLD